MNISISTANFYKTPFKETLEIIRRAGFDYIELAGYWKGGSWEIAQHLKGIPVKDVLSMVEDSGLKISTLHDMGGVIEGDDDSIISPSTYEYLEVSNGDIPCLVFHTPHKKTTDNTWWQKYREKTIRDMNSIKGDHLICLENLPFFDDYIVPLTDPEHLYNFVNEADIFVNIDTTHYGQCNIDLKHATSVLRDRVKTIHISDFKGGKPHLYIGDGELDFEGFAKELHRISLHAVTLECGTPKNSNEDTVSHYERARLLTEEIFRKHIQNCN